MSGHIDIRTLSDYFLNRLTSEEETAVQEHLSVCAECRARLEAMRRLQRGMFGEEETSVERLPVFFRIVRSGWTKAAAAVIIACGIGIFTYDTVRNRSNVLEQHQIQDVRNIENEVFAIDTFDTEDSLYYQEKYGDDFLNGK
ncbi:putative uncharacterized protein [Alistipes sp. CAG:831]|nr:putative uncharacterized protein [Alistipes sp. CAG:831]